MGRRSKGELTKVPITIRIEKMKLAEIEKHSSDVREFIEQAIDKQLQLLKEQKHD